MFRYLKLKNYKSLVNLSVDFMGTRNKPKKMIVVYGENGVGKSNFASVFYTLNEFMRTRSVPQIREYIQKQANNRQDDEFINRLHDYICDTETIIKKCKTINSKDNMVLEFGIKVKGYNGIYYIETNDSRIVSEKLDFVWNKNLTNFYEIHENQEPKINSNIFKKSEYESEIRDLIDKYWGKHTFLSILQFEIIDKADDYVKKRIIKNFYDVIEYFGSFAIRLKDNHMEYGILKDINKIFENIDQGIITVNKEEQLDKTQSLLNEFFTRLYTDIKQVYYKKEYKDDKIQYNLFLKKLIYDRIIDIDIKRESTGTVNLLNIFRFLLSAVKGNTVIIDEIDNGIHDILVDMLLNNIYDSISGQLIITTHNTMFMESDIAKDCVYIFKVDKNANKELIPLTDFEERIHPNLNIRRRYLKGMYGGIPISMDIDFSELLEIID